MPNIYNQKISKGMKKIS